MSSLGLVVVGMSILSFISKRLADDWKLLAAIFSGITIAATLLAGAPVYISTLERQGIDTAIDRANQSYLNIYAASPYITLDGASLNTTEQAFDQALDDNIAEIYRGRVRYLKSPTFLVGTPQSPLVPLEHAPEDGTRVSRGYFHHIERIDEHVTFLQGRMASDQVVWEDGSPRMEAIIGEPAKDAFDLDMGDVVVFTPSLNHPMRAMVGAIGDIFASWTSYLTPRWRSIPMSPRYRCSLHSRSSSMVSGAPTPAHLSIRAGTCSLRRRR